MQEAKKSPADAHVRKIDGTAAKIPSEEKTRPVRPGSSLKGEPLQLASAACNMHTGILALLAP